MLMEQSPVHSRVWYFHPTKENVLIQRDSKLIPFVTTLMYNKSIYYRLI